MLEFDTDIDRVKVEADIRSKVDATKVDLPSDAEEPIISEINLSLYPVISIDISGDVPERALNNFANELSDRIEEIPSVLEVKIRGDREEILEVEIDETYLETYGITPDEVIRAVLLNNRLVAAGKLKMGKGSFNVKIPGLFTNREDVLSLPINPQRIGNTQGTIL